MRVIATVFCFFAAIIMMAAPVMACCVTGHTETGPISIQIAVKTTPPCHGTSDDQVNLNDSQNPEKYCSSCDDCAVSTNYNADLSSALSTQSEQNWVALINKSNFLPRQEVRLSESTGPPPRRRFSPVDSPLFGTDALLI